MKSSDATKETLVTSLAPAKEKLNIRGVKKLSNNGVLVETATKEDMERVLKSENLHAAALVTGLPAKKKSRIIIYDVPKDLTEKEFLSSLRLQKLNSSGKEKPQDEMIISHKNSQLYTGSIAQHHGIALEARQVVYMGWPALRVRDYLMASRC